MSCMVGSEISMKCMCSGAIPMTFRWHKDGHELTEDEHVKMSYETNSTELNLKNAQLSHCGKYECEAENKVGTQRCTAMVTVTGLSLLFENLILTLYFYVQLEASLTVGSVVSCVGVLELVCQVTCW